MPGCRNQQIAEREQGVECVAHNHDFFFVVVCVGDFSDHDVEQPGEDEVRCPGPGNIENVAADSFGEDGEQWTEHAFTKIPEVGAEKKYFYIAVDGHIFVLIPGVMCLGYRFFLFLPSERLRWRREKS